MKDTRDYLVRGFGAILGLILFLAPAMSLAADSRPAASASDSPLSMGGRKIAFNCDKAAYPDIREQIYRHEAKLYQTIQTPDFLKSMPSAKDGDYCLAVVDLQDRGRRDVIAYANFGSYFCSAVAPVCLTKVIVNGPDGEWRDVLNVMLSKDDFTVLDQKANGYHLLKTHGYNILTTQMKTGEPERQDTIWYYDLRKKVYVAVVPKNASATKK